jgi:hypothetical protein
VGSRNPLPLGDETFATGTYQEDVGGPAVPLTAEVLRRRGSSRSTKSNESQVESDFRKSVEKVRNINSVGDDMFSSASIEFEEDGEIEIKRQKNLRNGSAQSSVVRQYGSRGVRPGPRPGLGTGPGAGGPSAHAVQHLNPGQAQQAQMYPQQMSCELFHSLIYIFHIPLQIMLMYLEHDCLNADQSL